MTSRKTLFALLALMGHGEIPHATSLPFQDNLNSLDSA